MTTQTQPVVDRLLTVPETAALLRVSPKTLRWYALEGRLARVQFVERGVWKFKARDVQRFIDSRAEEAP